MRRSRPVFSLACDLLQLLVGIVAKAGGDLGFADVLQIWDETGLQSVLEDNPGASDLLASLDSQDIDALMIGPDFNPVSADDQSRLDEKKLATCPECGHEFRP